MANFRNFRKIHENFVPEFPITGGIQARGGRGMFAVERHRGAWILMRVQARKDILESKSFLLFLSELLLGYGATLLEGPKIWPVSSLR